MVCMANTKPIVDNKETLSYVLEEGKKTGIHVLSCAAVSMGFKGQELTDMEGLLAAGAAGFTDDGIPLMDGLLCAPPWKKPRGWIPCSAFMRRTRHLLRKMESTMERYRTSWESMVPRRWQRTSLGCPGSCMIALDTGATVDIQHISSGHSVEMVRLAKKLGAKVWAEVTPIISRSQRMRSILASRSDFCRRMST
mgnify:CR=1 FL=1